MKTVELFIEESQNYDLLEDFTLTSKEWKEFAPGTRAYRVKMYNDSGNLLSRVYVLEALDNMDEVLEDMQQVAAGYYTDTCLVSKK